MGIVEDTDYDNLHFKVKCRSGDEFYVNVADGTGYFFIRNLDGLHLDRTTKPDGYDDGLSGDRLKRYIRKGFLVAAYGVYQINDDKTRFDAKEIWMFQNEDGQYLFEDTHWWITQITALADKWLLNLFGPGDTFDFTNYQTNLSFVGSKTLNRIQECATLSRLIYGLSSAYLMTGNDRYYRAARAGVDYQRDTFRTESHDGSFIIWSHAYNPDEGKKIMPSRFGDDLNAIPLYEQIYAIAGLTQFYRITNDWETLDDIRRTICFFNNCFHDKTDNRGYYSHIDYATLTPDTPVLGDNQKKKNWNSIGDHTPAYLLNLMLALNNQPSDFYSEIYEQCRNMQIELADIISERFPDPNKKIPYVQERFYHDWRPDKTYKWQQDRAVIGHNLKISWNLTRVYNLLGDQKYLDLAVELADSMQFAGLDRIRGGWFDVVEREPKNNMQLDFTWHNRKAWWQQEQGILAYLIMFGSKRKPEYLQLARESIAFWNMTYLDLDYGGVYSDVTDNGLPYTKEVQSMKGSHSKSGYHVFELNYLAHIYIRSFVQKKPFRLHFKPCLGRGNEIINVMPDYLPDGTLSMGRVYVDGQEFHKVNRDSFQVDLGEFQKEVEVAVEFVPNENNEPGKI